jgi:hypothetical protein
VQDIVQLGMQFVPDCRDLRDHPVAVHHTVPWSRGHAHQKHALSGTGYRRRVERRALRVLRAMKNCVPLARLVLVGAHLLLALMILGACSRDRFAKGERALSLQPLEEPVAANPGFPRTGCLRDVALTASLLEVRALAPKGSRAKPEPQDRAWEPDELIDIDVRPDVYAVVDRIRPAVMLLSASDFKRRWEVGRLGDGPGEFREPVAVRFDPRGDTLWVLDAVRQRLIAFDLRGQFVREMLVPQEITSFTMTRDGKMLVTPLVVASRVRGEAEVISELSTRGQLSARYTIPAKDLFDEGFVLPGPNRPRISLIGTEVALLSPHSGVLTVLAARGDQLVKRITLRGCITATLADAYRTQFDERKNPQASVEIVADVALYRDTLWLLGARKDGQNRYGVQRFLLSDGSPVGAIAARTGRMLPQELRFRPGQPNAIVAMDPDKGYVANLEFKVGK